MKRAKPSRSFFQKARAELIPRVPAVDLLAGFNVARFTALLLNGVLVVVVRILGFETGLMCQVFKLGVMMRFLTTSLQDFGSTAISGRSRCTDPRHPCMLGSFELRAASSLRRCFDQLNLILCNLKFDPILFCWLGTTLVRFCPRL